MKKKFIAPIVVCCSVIAYWIFMIFVANESLEEHWFVVILSVIFIPSIIYLTIERINEIKEDKKNDIDKY